MELTILSKQLAISIAFSVMTMSAFAVSMSPTKTGPNAGLNASPEYSNGAIAETTAPSVFSVFAN